MTDSLSSNQSSGKDIYYQKERLCEYKFDNGGPYWHLYTNGQITEILFRNDNDFRFGVTNTALCAAEFDVKIITDVIMSNHLHFIIEGEEIECHNLFAKYRKRMMRYYQSLNLPISLSTFTANLIPITTIEAMRNETAYVNRNGYLINSNYTPFTYPWGSNNLYFNEYAQQIKGTPYKNLTYREQRLLCRARPATLPDNYVVNDNMILPISYSRFDLGQSFFRDAHHYYYMVSKNIESYCQIAKQLGDSIFLNDNEMFAVTCNLSIQKFQMKQPSLLPPSAKIEIAKIMSQEYNSSNTQIRRILKLDQNIVDELFPKKAK